MIRSGTIEKRTSRWTFDIRASLHYHDHTPAVRKSVRDPFVALLSFDPAVPRRKGKKMNRLIRLQLVIFALASISPPASLNAATVFVATLDGAQNVPPLSVPGTGTARLVLNDDETEVAYEITYSDLTSTETAAHFHEGGPRENGAPLYGLPLGPHKVGIWPVGPDVVAELFAGRVYVNIHTEIHITGELRGNIHQFVPTDYSTWGRVKALFGTSR